MARKKGKVQLKLRDVPPLETLKVRLKRLKGKIPIEYYAFLAFLVYTGVRISEALQVRVKDIRWGSATEYGVVRIKQLKKREETYREVILHPELEMVLREYIMEKGLSSDDLLFPWTRQWGWELSKRYLGVRPHACRHAVAQQILIKTRDLDLARRQLGHSSYEVLKAYLDYSLRDRAREIVEALS